MNENKPVELSFDCCFGTLMCPAVRGSDSLQSYLQLFVYSTEAVKFSCWLKSRNLEMPDMQTVPLHLAFLNREIINTYGLSVALYHSQQASIICHCANLAVNINDQHYWRWVHNSVLSLKNVLFHAGGSCPPWETASLTKSQGVGCEGRTSCRNSISGRIGSTGQVAPYTIIPAFTVGLLWMTVLYPRENANSSRNTFWGNELLSAWRERCCPA